MRTLIPLTAALLFSGSGFASGTYGRIYVIPPAIASNILQTVASKAFCDDYEEAVSKNASGRTYGSLVNEYYVTAERDVGDRNLDAAFDKIVSDFSCCGMNISKHTPSATRNGKCGVEPKNDYQINDDITMIGRRQVFIRGTTVTDKDTFNVFTEIDNETETARMVIDTRSLAEMRAAAPANKRYIMRWSVTDGDATDLRRCPSIQTYRKKRQ